MLTASQPEWAPSLAAAILLWGLLAMPASAQTVGGIEYYNASQDHYFISSLQPDIDA